MGNLDRFDTLLGIKYDDENCLIYEADTKTSKLRLSLINKNTGNELICETNILYWGMNARFQLNILKLFACSKLEEQLRAA